jgi:hypothetical protein
LNSEIKIPTPQDSGADGSQIKAEMATPKTDTQQVGMAQAITGLAASNSRAFGGEVASTLIAGATSQMSIELMQTKQELKDLRESYSQQTQDLANERIQSAVLSERIDSYISSRHLKNISISIGSVLIGIGITLITNKLEIYGFSSLIIGAILMIFSWASAPKGGGQ